ncbi:hypothetical protein CYMTET_31527 [Cymbomonas tetramitiformis]|uniref:Uncharacterized protein n=1 Tax=Cymbomonas tetramitiformis TaxID=36881 RepID=A0AAE0KT54_9CHLO|nr:hypothetical protein CYMTET_31527 [Cymbomonas tetramitiformis]
MLATPYPPPPICACNPLSSTTNSIGRKPWALDLRCVQRNRALPGALRGVADAITKRLPLENEVLAIDEGASSSNADALGKADQPISVAAEWKSRGNDRFAAGLYPDAIDCYNRAKLALERHGAGDPIPPPTAGNVVKVFLPASGWRLATVARCHTDATVVVRCSPSPESRMEEQEAVIAVPTWRLQWGWMLQNSAEEAASKSEGELDAEGVRTANALWIACELNAVRSHLPLGELQEAAAGCERAALTKPSSAAAWFLWGRVEKARRHTQRAKDFLGRAAMLQPDDAAIKQMLAKLG